jgi:hypothetical protein
MYVAPSVFPKSRPAPVAPAALAQRVLDRLGDARFVHRVELGKPPPITFQHTGYWSRGRPPSDAIWAYIAAPQARESSIRADDPGSARTYRLAHWEAQLVKGALRDEFCAAGGPPLVGWTISGQRDGISDGTFAFLKRFPNPPAAVLRARVAQAASRYGFRVVELRLLHPLQTAPLLVVETDRDRKEFVADVPKILALVNPNMRRGGKAGPSYEGFFFEALDEDGPFVSTENVYRAHIEGGQWSWSPCYTPYQTLGTLGSGQNC